MLNPTSSLSQAPTGIPMPDSSDSSALPEDTISLDVLKRNLERTDGTVVDLEKDLADRQRELSESRQEAADSENAVKEYTHQMKIEKFKDWALVGVSGLSIIVGLAAGAVAFATASLRTLPIFAGACLTTATAIGAFVLISKHADNSPDTVDQCYRRIDYHTRNSENMKYRANKIERRIPSLNESLFEARKEKASLELSIMNKMVRRDTSVEGNLSVDDTFIMIDGVKLGKKIEHHIPTWHSLVPNYES